jgi:hypothetical protein
MAASIQDWRTKWFYIKDQKVSSSDEYGIAPIVGMTSGACQGPCYLPAGVPGISTVLGREDRLCPKGRLRQQPAGDSTEESQSRAMKTRIL